LFKRTHTCGEITAALERQIVTINGWVDRVRNLGGVLFVTIRDRYGKIQVLFRPEDGSLFSEAASLHGEDVVAVTGEIAKRPEGAIKEEMGGPWRSLLNGWRSSRKRSPRHSIYTWSPTSTRNYGWLIDTSIYGGSVCRKISC